MRQIAAIVTFALLSANVSNVNAQTFEQRVDYLISELTLEEKVGLMQNHSKGVERLGIKPYDWWSEALHGVARAGIATVFPEPIGMAASFDDELLFEVFTAVSDEARAKHTAFNKQNSRKRYQGLTFWTPNVNIFRDPRWGRGQETYGEDPYLTSRMGTTVVRALQGPADTKYNKLHACAKHYAVHSGPEATRHQFNAELIDPRDLWETYLPAFHELVKVGVKEVMCAYNRYEGEPCCGSNRLLQQILRDEWGFNGIVVTDCWALSDFYEPGHHETHPDAEHASSDAMLSGTDLECGDSFGSLINAVNQGLITEADIDKSLRRILLARMELGDFDPDEDNEWAQIPYSVVDSEEHKALALKMTQETIVLLKNQNNILPLDRNVQLSLWGPNANDSTMQWGNYNGKPSHTVTLAEALTTNQKANKRAVGNGSIVVYAGGINPRIEGEEDLSLGFTGDKTTIELPEKQISEIKKLYKRGCKIIYVNFSGSCMGLESIEPYCEAIIQAWYPGQAGGTAIANVLYGDYNPCGKLPVTFYKSDAQLPDYEDYSMKNRTYRYFTDEPLYPFGYGLSYTSFELSNLKLVDRDIHVTVSNTGNYDGAEVVQVYIRRVGDDEGPIKALRQFKRVFVPAGESRDLVLSLTPASFETFDTGSNTMRALPGEYQIFIGNSSLTTQQLDIVF